jgi:hypothetical protein
MKPFQSTAGLSGKTQSTPMSTPVQSGTVHRVAALQSSWGAYTVCSPSAVARERQARRIAS